jgi:2-iminobutanoate/2-iminopropanoate deaminase
MNLTFVSTDHAPRAIGPYSQGVVLGDLVFTAGQIPLDPVTGEVVAGPVGEQTALALRNLGAILEAAGSSLGRVVKTTVYLVDMGDFAPMNEVYSRAFGDHRPARSTVAVAQLPRGVRIEIDAIAVRA